MEKHANKRFRSVVRAGKIYASGYLLNFLAEVLEAMLDRRESLDQNVQPLDERVEGLLVLPQDVQNEVEGIQFPFLHYGGCLCAVLRRGSPSQGSLKSLLSLLSKKLGKKGRLSRAVGMPLPLDLEGLLHPILLESGEDLFQRSVIRDLFLLIC